MREIKYSIIMLFQILFLSACDVHQWPEAPDSVKCHIRLNYDASMTEWNHNYDGKDVLELGYGDTYDSRRDDGIIRYIIRTYPISDRKGLIQDYTQEFVLTKEISEGYDHEVTLDLLPGRYNVMVWSDLVQGEGDPCYYDASNFAEIRLQGEHSGNNDYRDAFRGSGNIELVSDIVAHSPDTLDILMQRPLAKFELISNDLGEFIEKEAVRVASKAEGNDSSLSPDVPTKTIDIDDYKVAFYYVGFMYDTYSMTTDKPVDSSTGVLFESSLNQLTESEATIGFDYIFVNGENSSVTVQIGIFDKEGTRISLSEPIQIPLRRSYHTIIRGMFLMSEASGGVAIHPDYDGDHNVIFP